MPKKKKQDKSEEITIPVQVESIDVEVKVTDVKLAVGEEAVKDKKDQKTVDLALASIEKDFGEGSIMRMSSYSDANPVSHISSGSLAFDIILGKGGFCFGRTIEMYGPEGSGKSTTCLSVIAGAQALGLRCAYIDMEQALDPDYATTLGVNIGDLYIAQPPNGEQALGIAERLINSAAFDVVIFDSIAAINPVKDLEKGYDENVKMAGRASLLTRFFERNNYTITKNKVLFFCTNQMRANLSPYGAPTQVSGGWSMKHSASQRIEIRPVEKLEDSNGAIYGNTVRVKTAKNRLNVPYKEARFDIVFGKGIDKVKDILTVATDLGIIEAAGAWFKYGELKFQGKAKVKQHFIENPEELKIVDAAVRTLVGENWGPEGK